MKLALYAATSLSTLLLADVAHAQGTPAPSLPALEPQQDATGSGLAEIVVTAQKRSENLQSVPIAITAASGDQLAQRGITNTQQLNVLAPGLNIRVTAGSFQPSLRGISTSSTVSENPVALYIDGVYIPQQRDGTRELEDIDQVAVLKGPQGTLFGRNATAGVIQITTKAPSFTFNASTHAELDNYVTLRAGGYITGGLTDNIAMAASVAYVKQGNGWGRNFITGNDTNQVLHDLALRAKILFKLGARTDFTLIGDYANSKRYTTNTVPLPGTRFSFANPYTSNSYSLYDSFAGNDPFGDLHGGGVSGTLNHNFGGVKLVSITAYRDINTPYSINNTSVPQFYQVSITPKAQSKSFSQEVQLLSTSTGPFTWVAGVFYFNYDNGSNPIHRFFAGPLVNPVTQIVGTYSYATENSRSVAPFGEAKWEFLPATHLTFGARYTWEWRHLKNSRVESVNASGTVTTVPYDKQSDYKDPTFRIGLDHQFTDTILGYVSYNTGFKSGGFNSVSPATPGYNPEKLKAYEAGVKSTLFDRRLRLNASGFYYDYTNLQVVQFINAVQTVINGPKAHLYGLDLDFAAKVTPALQVSGGFEVLHATFQSFPGAVFSTPLPAGGAVLFSGDATGKRLPLAQKFTGNLAVDYHFGLPRGGLDFNVTANYNGDYYFQVDNLIRQKAYTILNSALTWTLPGGKLSLKVFGRNLLNEKIITTTTEQAIGYATSYNAAPRTFGGGFAYKF